MGIILEEHCQEFLRNMKHDYFGGTCQEFVRNMKNEDYLGGTCQNFVRNISLEERARNLYGT